MKSVGSEKRIVTVYTFMMLLATLTQSTINVEYFGEGGGRYEILRAQEIIIIAFITPGLEFNEL